MSKTPLLHVLMLLAVLAGAAESKADQSAALANMGWDLLVLPDDSAPRFWKDAEGAIAVGTAGDAGFLYRPLKDTGGPLSWRWRVEAMGPGGDPMDAGADDRPLALHLWFPPEARDRSLKKTLAGLFGYPVFGKVITYMWGTGATRGKRFANPYLDGGEGLVVVLRDRRDGLGTWCDEVADYAADFEAHFGYAPPAPAYLAVSGDSDDLGGESLARIADIGFSGQGIAR